MGRELELEGNALFHTLAGVARELRDEIGAQADLRRNPVWQSALCLVGLESFADEPYPEQRMARARGIIDAMHPRANDE